MKNSKSIFGAFLALLVLLPGCILHVPRYTRQPLSIVGDHFTYNEIQENLNVQVKQLSSLDTYYLFNDWNKEFLRRNGIRIVYFSIHNLSNNNYMISPYDIDLKQVSYKDIDRLMKKTSSTGRFVIAGFSGLLNSAACALATIPNGIAIVYGTIGALATSFIFYPALVQGIKSVVMNRRINKDLKDKTLHEKTILNSGDHYEGLIFVKSSDYKSQFSITMHEKDNVEKSITFNIDLSKSEL